MGQLHRAAAAAGWTFENATTLDTGDGIFDLVRNSPAALERVYRAHYRRQLDIKATRSILGEQGGCDQYGRPDILHFQPARQLRNSLLKQQKADQARLLLRLVTGTLWTSSRLHHIAGIEESCDLCNLPRESALHWVMDCPAQTLLRREH